VLRVQYETVGLLAATLAHLRRDLRGASLARILGPEALDRLATARMQPIRFRSLLRAEDANERLLALRRMLAMLDHAAPLADLVAACVDWTERRRARWTYKYWRAGANPSNQGNPISAGTE